MFRLGPGDVISLLNGKGLAYKAIIERMEGGIVCGRIEQIINQMEKIQLRSLLHQRF